MMSKWTLKFGYENFKLMEVETKGKSWLIYCSPRYVLRGLAHGAAYTLLSLKE